MSDDKVTQNNTEETKTPVATPATETKATEAPAVKTDAPVKTDTSETKTAAPAKSFNNNRGGGPQKREFKKNRRAPRRGRERPRPEFEQKILGIRRVTRVSSGGRRFSFSVTMALGDKKGRVGVGVGKAGDTALAIEKAIKAGKKAMITVPRTATNSISHEVSAKYCSGRVIMMPAPGRGVIAGSAVRDLFELAGLTDVNAKIISGTKNKLNIARATLKAFEGLAKPTGSQAPKEGKKDTKNTVKTFQKKELTATK